MNLTISQIKEKVIPTLQEAGVVRSSLFGSIARGEDTSESDIDILVEFEKPVGFFSFCHLQNQLQDILKKNVDLLTYKSVHPLIKDYISRDEVKIL